MYALACLPKIPKDLDSNHSQIAQSLRTFGITTTTKNLLVIKLSTSTSIKASTVSDHLATTIKGTQVDFSDQTLAPLTDIAKVRKLYKLGGVGEDSSKGKRRRKDGSAEGSRGEEAVERIEDGSDRGMERRELEVALLGLMALRGAV